MPTSLSFDEHLAALDRASDRLVERAEAAGLDAPVPTCPTWTVAHLLAHQAMVHRWATANVCGEDPDGVPTQTAIREEVAHLPTYFREGAATLHAVLRAAPPDLEAMRFLNDAPPPRQFWARRQAHETTMHMVDAESAARGRFPTTAEVAIDPPLAADGLDELLRGFFSRGKSKLFDGAELTMVVAPSDVHRRWVAHVAERLTVEPGDGDTAGSPDVMLTGTAAGLYLALWNRGDDVEVTGQRDLVDRWHATQRVTWS